MSKAVLDLQENALDPAISVSSLLRKTHVIAKKLSLSDFDAWCGKELHGYRQDETKKPHYRIITMSVRAWNPYRGFIPVVSEDSELTQVLTKPFIEEPIDQVESMANSGQESLTFALTPQMQKYLTEASGLQFEVKAFASRAQFVGILQAVRNLVLDWTLELERTGVLGEGLEFTATEKSIATDNITNYGTMIIGSVSDSRVQRDATHSDNNYGDAGMRLSEVNGLIAQMIKHLNSIPLERESMQILKRTLDELKAEVANKIPNPTKVTSLFYSIKNVLENAAGSVIASGIIFEISRLFPS